MMNVTIWHKATPNFRESNGTVLLNEFKAVAVVAVTQLEESFQITQNMDSPWIYGSRVVVPEVVGPCRSTSVGDLVETDNGFFEVASMGYKKVTPVL